MLFNSLQFALFFPVVTALYFILPQRYRWFMLLVASCVFYAAFIPAYLLILFVLIAIDYAAGLMIERAAAGQKRYYLLVSIVSTCLVLFVFKYYGFFNANLSRLAGLIHWNYPVPALNLILPIGLSFHTFQSLSYVIEVYRGKQKAEHHLGIYALYVMFYPQLVAGPIERPGHMLHQFYEHHRFDYQRVTDGLKLMAWGLFKKVVVADRLVYYVDAVYKHPSDQFGIALLTATFFFAFQIYCDFSGYSDIAVGAAKVMGFRLMQNFKRPYFAKSIGEFWQRWHISLSSWFRDYVYIPLGGNRVPFGRWEFNVIVTFLLSGLWHGANWTFVIWGMLHGLYYIAESAARRSGLAVSSRFFRAAGIFCLVGFAWIFFRASSLSDALCVIRRLPTGYVYMVNNLDNYRFFGLMLARQGLRPFLLAWLGIMVLSIVELIQRRGSIIARVRRLPPAVRWALYYALIMSIVLFGAFDRNYQFIYFQF